MKIIEAGVQQGFHVFDLLSQVYARNADHWHLSTFVKRAFFETGVGTL
jgi:hypothetical protein